MNTQREAKPSRRRSTAVESTAPVTASRAPGIRRAARRAAVLRSSANWPDLARLQVIDNGVGTAVEPQAVATASGHIGIASHRVRVEEAGGSLTIRPRHPAGTVADVTLPLSTDAGPLARPGPARAAIDRT